MNASEIAGIATFIVVFPLALLLLLAARKRRADRKHQAARIARREQLTDRLMATSLKGRKAATFVALAMINAGPCHLMNDKMRGRILWADHFLANLGQVVSSINGLSLNEIYTGPFEGKDNVLDTLASSREFMYFILRSYVMIDAFLGHYWTSLDEIYSDETRDAVRADMVNAEAFVNVELNDLHKEFASLASA